MLPSLSFVLFQHFLLCWGDFQGGLCLCVSMRLGAGGDIFYFLTHQIGYFSPSHFCCLWNKLMSTQTIVLPLKPCCFLHFNSAFSPFHKWFLLSCSRTLTQTPQLDKSGLLRLSSESEKAPSTLTFYFQCETRYKVETSSPPPHFCGACPSTAETLEIQKKILFKGENFSCM